MVRTRLFSHNEFGDHTASAGNECTKSGHALEALEPRVLLSSVPYGADYRDNSEFMLGTVHVDVVLLESDGAVDANLENWSATRIQNVKQQITLGLQWWEQTLQLQNTQHELQFQIDFTHADAPVQTSYEPIARSWRDQSLWINDFLTQVGGKDSSSIFTDMRQWNHAQRQQNDANWAFTVFVVDSQSDTDGAFADYASAYAYIGGPFMVMTYDNGGWGIERMQQVLAHETAHLFYALDEYAGSRSYYDKSGYYSTQNLNAYDQSPDLASRVTSLMSDGNSLVKAYSAHTSSPSSLEAIGWRDSDGNGVFDVLDVPLSLSGAGSYDAASNLYQFTGSSQVGVLNNLNPYGSGNDITLNTVDQLQYRLDGGDWIVGSELGGYVAAVNETVVVDFPGSYTIDFRTVHTQTGIASNLWSDSFEVTGAEPGFLVTPTTNLVTGENGDAASFSVVLKSRPTADVIIPVTSSDSTEGSVSTSSLTFTAENWDRPQVVIVTGVNDQTYDGDQTYRIESGAATSQDASYDGLTLPHVSLTNLDNNVPPAVVIRADTQLNTTEDGGAATFSIVLNSKPTADVYISVQSTHTDEGVVSTSLLHFTAANWNTAQTLVVTGVADGVKDGNQNYAITFGPTTSNDPAWDGLAVASVELTNQDNYVSPAREKKTGGGGNDSGDEDNGNGGGNGGGNGNGGGKFKTASAGTLDDALTSTSTSTSTMTLSSWTGGHDTPEWLLALREQYHQPVALHNVVWVRDLLRAQIGGGAGSDRIMPMLNDRLLRLSELFV